MLQKWNLLPISKKCAKSGAVFEQNDQVISILIFSHKDNEFQRLDFLAKFWDKISTNYNPHSIWKHSYFSEKKEILSKLSSENLQIYKSFRNHLSDKSEEAQKKCQLLAWLLERRKVFKKQKNSKNDGFAIYQNKIDGEVIVIPEKEISISESDELYEKLKPSLNVT